MAADPSYLIPQPPPGEVRTLENPPSSGGGIIPAAVATTIIALIVVTLRIYTRTAMIRGLLGLDDYLVVIAMMISIAFCGLSIHLKNLDCGLHGWDMLLSNYSPPYLATTMGITMTYCTSVSFAKLSVLVFYLRLSPEKTFRIGVYCLIGLTTTYTVTYIVVILLVCRPVAANWDLSLAEDAQCFSKMVPMMTLSVANIVIDFAILLIPVHVVVPLQMPRRQKLSLLLLFATGGFVCAAAIYRTYILPGLLQSDDYTWDNPPQNVWGSIEANAGIFCASVPALKPFFKKYLPFLLSSRFRSNDMSNSGPFDAFATKADRNRKRRQDKSYELSSRDKSAPGNSFPVDDGLEDEMRLWPQVGRDATGVKTMTAVHETSSAESIPKDQPPPWSPDGPRVNVSSSNRPNRPNHGSADIRVTRETKITYGSAH